MQIRVAFARDQAFVHHRRVPFHCQCSHRRVATRRAFRAPLRGGSKADQRLERATRLKAFNEGGLRKEVELPVNPLRLLGLSERGQLRDNEITAAYEDLLGAGHELSLQGYTPHTSECRTQLLQYAFQDAVEHKSMGGDMPLLVIPHAWLPAALAVLVEVSEHGLAAELARRWLKDEKNNDSDLRPDVCVALAAAYCAFADEQLESADPNQVPLGCARLSEARSLLQQAGSTAQHSSLLTWIDSNLNKHLPYIVLDRLSGRLQPDERASVVESFKGLLDNPGQLSAAGGNPRVMDSGYMMQVLQRLAAPEIVSLQKWSKLIKASPQPDWLSGPILYMAGMAHLVTGFTARKPELILEASQLFQYTSQNADVEKAMCAALLGGSDEAMNILQKGLTSSRPVQPLGGVMRPTCVEVKDIIDRHSKPEDPLPGLVLFLQEWLAEVAFVMFKDTRESRPSSSLKAYGDDPQVANYLARHSQSRAVLGFMQNALDSVTTRGAEIVQSIRARNPAAAAEAEAAAVDTPVALPAEPPQKPQGTNPAAIMAGIAFVALIAGAFLFRGRGRSTPATIATPAVATSVTSPSSSVGTASSATSSRQFTASQANDLVLRWQRVKQRALGQGWEADSLSAVLHGEALSQYKSIIADAKVNNWYWRYKLHHCKVNDIDASTLRSGGGGYASVTAEISETADIVSVDGKLVESLKATYDVRYRIVETDPGVWKISQVQVQTPVPQ